MQNATLHDVDFELTTLRDIAGTSTLMIGINGDDCEISDSRLVNRGGAALESAKSNRMWILRNAIISGTTRVNPDTAMPYTDASSSVGGGDGLYQMRTTAIVGNSITNESDLGASATMFIEYDAHDLYIADNTIGPNLSNYGEGFSFDAPYYPNWFGTPTQKGRSITLPRTKNKAGNAPFGGPLDGTWPANGGLVGNSVIVVNGKGLGQYAAIVSNSATASDGSTTVVIDRDLAVSLDATSVISVAPDKSEVVFARNTFHDVAVGAQLYAGGYDFVIDGTKGEAIEGTYCYSYDTMSSRESTTDQWRRYASCYFNQWINTTLTDHVDASYPWAKNKTGGISTPFTGKGLVGVRASIGQDPLIPAQRGVGAIGNIVRNNSTDGYTYGFVHANQGPMPSPMPTFGRDGIVESNAAKSVNVGTFVDTSFPYTFVKGSSCSGCTTNVTDNGG